MQTLSHDRPLSDSSIHLRPEVHAMKGLFGDCDCDGLPRQSLKGDTQASNPNHQKVTRTRWLPEIGGRKKVGCSLRLPLFVAHSESHQFFDLIHTFSKSMASDCQSDFGCQIDMSQMILAGLLTLMPHDNMGYHMTFGVPHLTL